MLDDDLATDMSTNIATLCASCGRVLDDALPNGGNDWVMLAPEVLYVGAHEFDLPSPPPGTPDAAFDWCSVECFARYVFAAAFMLKAFQRPDAPC